MPVNNPHSVDRAYKFNYKMLGIIFHHYLYHKGDKIEFIETEIPNTGQRKDMMVKVDDELIQITEFMSKALDKNKLKDIFQYHVSTLLDPEYKDLLSELEFLALPNRVRVLITWKLMKMSFSM